MGCPDTSSAGVILGFMSVFMFGPSDSIVVLMQACGQGATNGADGRH